MRAVIFAMFFTLPCWAQTQQVIVCQFGLGNPNKILMERLEVAAQGQLPFKQNESFASHWKSHIQVQISKAKVMFVSGQTPLLDISSERELCGWEFEENSQGQPSATVNADMFSLNKNEMSAYRMVEFPRRGFSSPLEWIFRISINRRSGEGLFSCGSSSMNTYSKLRLTNCSSTSPQALPSNF